MKKILKDIPLVVAILIVGGLLICMVCCCSVLRPNLEGPTVIDVADLPEEPQEIPEDPVVLPETRAEDYLPMIITFRCGYCREDKPTTHDVRLDGILVTSICTECAELFMGMVLR